MYMTGTDLGHSCISSKNCRSYSAFPQFLSKDINFDSIVKWAIQVYLEDFQDMVAPPRVKMYSLVDSVL